MALQAGTHAHYTNSMAEAMENAFLNEWPNIMGGQPKPQPNDQMRLLFMAIAQGVVQHLTQHPEAFTAVVTAANQINRVTIRQDNTYTTLP